MWNYRYEKNYEADVSSIKTSSERTEGLCVFRGLYREKRIYAIAGKWWCERENILLEREEFSDSIRILNAELKTKFLFRVFIISVFSWCRERPQTVMSWLQCCGRFKWGASGWEAFLFFIFFVNESIIFKKAICEKHESLCSLWRSVDARISASWSFDGTVLIWPTSTCFIPNFGVSLPHRHTIIVSMETKRFHRVIPDGKINRFRLMKE